MNEPDIPVIGIHQLLKALENIPIDYYAVTDESGDLFIYDEYGSWYGLINFEDGELHKTELK